MSFARLCCAQSNLKLGWEKRDIAPMCVSFPSTSDTTTFVAGCEDGGLYECHMHGRSPGPVAVISAHNGGGLSCRFFHGSRPFLLFSFALQAP
jgi:hypothetical protein